MTLTKASVVDHIANNGYSGKEASDMVETLLEIIKGTLEKGDDLLISGFGKFSVKDKRKRKGRNPASGEEMMLSPRRVVTFKCSNLLREKINK